MRRDVNEVWKHSIQIVSLLQSWVRVRDNSTIILHYNTKDQLMLLRLRTWMLRYRLPITDILDILVPILREAVKHAGGKRTSGLGIAIATLTGQKARVILTDQIGRIYPDGAHIQMWRERERDRQLTVERMEETGLQEAPERELRLIDCTTPEVFIQRYERRIARLQERDGGSHIADRNRKKRRYRFSPWL